MLGPIKRRNLLGAILTDSGVKTDNLANFARRSGAKLVFGLNVVACAIPKKSHYSGRRCAGQAWDPTEAKALMEYLIKANHSVYGFELGNEQNTNYTPQQAVRLQATKRIYDRTFSL